MTAPLRNRSVKDDIRDYWTRRAETYDASPGHGLGARRAEWEGLVSRHLGPAGGRTALDLGCGTGEITMLLDRLGFQATGLDMTPKMMEKARTKATGTRLRFIECDAEATMEPTASYDVVVARYLFWTLTAPETALADWQRVLKPGGTLLLIDGDHVTPPPLAALGRLFDRWLGPDPLAGHAKVTPEQWAAHNAIVAQLPFRDGLRCDRLIRMLTEAGFGIARADTRPHDLAAFRPQGWRQRLLSMGRHRFAVSARRF